MLAKLSFITLKSIKAYGICSIIYEPIINVMQASDIDMLALMSALSVETAFFLLKRSQVNVPEWLEALEDLS